MIFFKSLELELTFAGYSSVTRQNNLLLCYHTPGQWVPEIQEDMDFRVSDMGFIGHIWINPYCAPMTSICATQPL